MNLILSRYEEKNHQIYLIYARIQQSGYDRRKDNSWKVV